MYNPPNFAQSFRAKFSYVMLNISSSFSFFLLFVTEDCISRQGVIHDTKANNTLGKKNHIKALYHAKLNQIT